MGLRQRSDSEKMLRRQAKNATKKIDRDSSSSLEISVNSGGNAGSNSVTSRKSSMQSKSSEADSPHGKGHSNQRPMASKAIRKASGKKWDRVRRSYKPINYEVLTY